MNILLTVRKLCEIHGTTIGTLEKEIGAGHGSIRNWEKSSPSIDSVIKVADYFNVSVDALLGRSFVDEAYSVASAYSRADSLTQDMVKRILSIEPKNAQFGSVVS